jgi:C-terminal processing protease CtpA/Prc
LENLPTVILVDGLSASSSEILALALKEKQGAVVV